MGSCAELSYERSRAAKSFHAQEIVPVEVTQRKKTITVDEDEEPSKDTSRLRSLRPAFLKDGTVTAANASKLNDRAVPGRARCLGTRRTRHERRVAARGERGLCGRGLGERPDIECGRRQGQPEGRRGLPRTPHRHERRAHRRE